MDIDDAIKVIAMRHAAVKDTIQTEEATKSALVMPFLSALGYDIFNPAEVLPEFTADIVNRKGEKIDFAIMSGQSPIILIECKRADKALSADNLAQLARYFMVVPARIGVLTNGIDYEFYSDINDSKILDTKPFFKFNIYDTDESSIKMLRRFSKGAFNINRILPIAEEMKFQKEIKGYLQEQTIKTDPEFIKFLAKQTYKGQMTSNQVKRFESIVEAAFNQFISEKISERLDKALKDEKKAAMEEQAAQEEKRDNEAQNDESKRGKIETTVEEIEGYSIIRAILRPEINVKRVVMRDALSYCAVLLDDNNRKPICRFFFSNVRKAITFGIENNETRHRIDDLDDIYDYSDLLKKSLAQYDKKEEV